MRPDDPEQIFIDLCDELGCAHDNEAALFAIAALKRRVKALELIISEDLQPGDCGDDLNRMLVEQIHENHR